MLFRSGLSTWVRSPLVTSSCGALQSPCAGCCVSCWAEFVKRLALGLAYDGRAYHGWQSQPDGQTVQDQVELALSAFADVKVKTVCAGRTDTGVHAMNQVIHIDPPVQRDLFSWVRGTNRFLPPDIAVQWCHPVGADFHARDSARGDGIAICYWSLPCDRRLKRDDAAGSSSPWTARP